MGAGFHRYLIGLALDDDALYFVFVGWSLFFGGFHVEPQNGVQLGKGVEAALCVLFGVSASVVVDVVNYGNAAEAS